MTAAATTADRPRVFHLVTQVWGEAFCDALTSICIPALLSPGNIPALAADWPCRFIVYTREEDIARITSTPAFERLRALVAVDFKVIDATLGIDKYSAMSGIHHRVLAAAAFEQAAIVWLVPDAVWSDGALRTVARAARAGKRAVMQPALRVVKETALPVLQAKQGHSVVSFTARELVALAMEHMHPYYRACFWDAPQFIKDPALTFWRVGEEGMLARAFHLHPLMLFPSRLPGSPFMTFDDELLLNTCPNYDDFHVIEDSDDGFHIDLTERDWCSFIPVRRRPASALFMAWWAINGANLHHRRFFSHPIRLHTGSMSSEWDRIELRTARLARQMRVWVAFWGAIRLPFELACGQSRAAILQGRYAPPKKTRGTNRFSRAIDLTHRQAFLWAYGWVFGYRSACRRVAVTPFLPRLHVILYAALFACDRLLAAIRSAINTWVKFCRKKVKGTWRRSSTRAVKQVNRQVSLARSRVKHARKLLRRYEPGRTARRRNRVGQVTDHR